MNTYQNAADLYRNPLKPLHIHVSATAALLMVAAIMTLTSPGLVFGAITTILALFVGIAWYGSGQHHKTLVAATDLVDRGLINADLVMRGSFVLDMAIIDKARKVIVVDGEVHAIEDINEAYIDSNLWDNSYELALSLKNRKLPVHVGLPGGIDTEALAEELRELGLPCRCRVICWATGSEETEP